VSLSVRPLEPGVAVRVPETFLQSSFWGAFKAEHGQQALRFAIESSTPCADLLVLVRGIGGGLCLAYVPDGPEADIPEPERGAFLAELSEALGPRLPPSCVFIRYDPPWFSREAGAPSAEEAEGGAEAESPKEHALRVEAARPRLPLPLRRAAVDVQPPDTVVVDLRPSEDSILGAMRSKWRYNIRLAEKKGVVVERAGAEAVPEFYALYGETARRDRIALHAETYYRRLFDLADERRAEGFAGTPDIGLWLAKVEGRTLAANVTLFHGPRAVYLFGASSDEKRNLMPTYALQWTAMRAAKALGCRSYDLYGMSPTDDPMHPMGGLYRFKTGFGGTIAHRAGSWDYPLRGGIYGPFRLAEKARAWWFKDFKKRLRRTKRG
jgi:lipid II:glycine glycyltransferase (peptidoglycan interpeptide bridge formation enzyme)